jgi:hypothetical protein
LFDFHLSISNQTPCCEFDISRLSRAGVWWNMEVDAFRPALILHAHPVVTSAPCLQGAHHLQSRLVAT